MIHNECSKHPKNHLQTGMETRGKLVKAVFTQRIKEAYSPSSRTYLKKMLMGIVDLKRLAANDLV